MKIGGKVTNPGELNQRVVLAKPSITQNENGAQIEGLAFVALVWAKWTNVHGSEVWASQAVQAIRPATVLVRYRSDIDPTCVLVLGATVSDVVEDDVVVGKTFTGGDQYKIVSMDDISNRHEYVELKVQGIKGSV